MIGSILNDTKKQLGIARDYTAFDLDVIIHINATLSTLHQLGVGPTVFAPIDSEEADWEDLALPGKQLGIVRSYMYLKVRMLFDPPSTSFHIEAMNKMIAEYEWRLGAMHDETIDFDLLYPPEVPLVD